MLFFKVIYLDWQVSYNRFTYTKKCWVISSQIWVKYGQTQMSV